MTATTQDAQTAQASPLGGLPPSWLARARLLELYTVRAAEARRVLMVAYAQAYLDTDGTAEYRTQTAKRETASHQLDADRAKARLDAYKLMIDAEMAGL